jgi:hypothetical protein
MHTLQNAYFAQAFRPLDANGVTVTALAMDSGAAPAGYNELTVLILTGNVAGDMTALKLQHADTSAGSPVAYADVTGGNFGATTPLPLGTGGDNGIWACMVTLTGNGKRYYKVVATAAAQITLIAGVGIFTRPNVAPDTATLRGLVDGSIIQN